MLADAGYLYNAPNVHSSLTYHHHPRSRPVHRHRPQPIRSVRRPHEDEKITYSVSYKDYIYLKADNYNPQPHQANPSYNHVQVHGNTGHVESHAGNGALQNIQTNVGHSHNGYDGYAQPLTSAINYNNNYAQPHIHPAINTHSHHHHTAPVHTSSYVQTNQLPATVSYSNSYVQTSPVVHNTGYAHTATAPSNNNYNSYSQVTGPSAVNLNNVYTQTSIQSATNNLNQGYVTNDAGNGNNGWIPRDIAYSHSDTSQPSHANIPVNSAYSQGAQVSAPSNIGYGHNSHASAPSNDGYGQVAQVSPILSTGYSQVATNAPVSDTYSQSYAPSNNDQSQIVVSSVIVPPPPALDSNNGYAHTVSSSTSNNVNTAYAQVAATSQGTNVNSGYEQTIPTGNANINAGYVSSSTASLSNINNPLAPSLTPTASGISSGSYSEISSGSTHIDFNSGITQSLSSSSLDNGFAQSLTSANDNLNSALSTGLAQSNFNTAVNPSPANPPVTPIIHKHIYFHVPPPEIEEPERVTPPPPPPKKNYKILFIKVPSQESKSNLIRLQQQIEQMNQAAVEEKTLIYVLVKKPEEPEPVVLPEPKPSEHQVYFVRYGGNPFDIASQVNDELVNTGAIKSIVPLEPGLVNGQLKKK